MFCCEIAKTGALSQKVRAQAAAVLSGKAGAGTESETGKLFRKPHLSQLESLLPTSHVPKDGNRVGIDLTRSISHLHINVYHCCSTSSIFKVRLLSTRWWVPARP